MTRKNELWFKARITEELDDAITQIGTELGLERSAAGRELMRRGEKNCLAPVVIRPQWADADLVAINALREPAHQIHQAAKELRTLVEEECGDNIEVRCKIAETAKQAYGQYIALRNLRDALTRLSAEDVESLNISRLQFQKQASDGNQSAATLARFLGHLGF